MSAQPRSTPPAADHAAGQIRLGELLSDRAFALYLAGQTTSGAGGALSSVALVFAVLSISRSASSLGLVLLASRLPGIVLTLAGGIIADRWSRQRIAVCADVTRTGLQALTGALLLSGHATVLALAGLQVLSGGASAIFSPAAGALAAGVAPRGQIRRASSLLGITTAVAQTGGLAISGVIVALAGPGSSFLIDSATFAVSSLTLALIPDTAATSSQRRTVLRDLRDGWGVVSAHRWLLVYAAHETVLNVLALSPFFVLGPLIAKQHLGGAPAWSAIALGYVVGNLTAAHITYHWSPRRPVLAALLISAALGPLLALLGLHAPLWLIVAAAVLAGAETTIYNTLLSSALQSNLPSDTLGRATAITGIGSSLLVPAGMGLAGILADALGVSTVLIAGAGLIIAATAICASMPSTHALLHLSRH
jgi:MFS family permease